MIPCLGAIVLVLAQTAMAQPGTGGLAADPRSRLAVANCSEARDPQRCLAMRQARLACQSKRGPARRQCLRERLPPPDCNQAPDEKRCLAQQAAQAACQGKLGKALRACLRNFQRN